LKFKSKAEYPLERLCWTVFR